MASADLVFDYQPLVFPRVYIAQHREPTASRRRRGTRLMQDTIVLLNLTNIRPGQRPIHKVAYAAGALQMPSV